MKITHTTGPWTAYETPTGFDITAKHDHFTIAVDVDRENSNLIAAAPDLLAALEQLLSEVTGFQECCGDKGISTADAIKAIALARGAA